MIAVRGHTGRRVGVLGMGRSGLAAARALAAGEATPVCWDDGEAGRAAAEAEGFAVEDLTRDRAWTETALLVVSPGVAHLHPAPHPAVVAAQAAGAALDNEVGLFFRALAMTEAEVRVVAVTGSNGKSTTSALIAHLLAEAGRPAQLGGNIGRAVLDLDPPLDGETLVLELSSYQLELARSLAADVAVFLNLSPDHLDRHGGMGGYFAAKRRLFELGAPERYVVGVDDIYGRHLATLARQEEDGPDGRVTVVSAADRLRGDGWSVFMNRAHLTEWRRGKQAAAFDMRQAPALRGAHNHQNACAAWAAARALGLGPRALEAGLRSFAGLPYRMQQVASRGGVAFVNDSKATNADAAEKALLSYDRIRWIAGGVPKAGGIASLAPLFARVAKAYLIGEAAQAFAAQLGTTDHAVCGDLERATRMAAAEAQDGDTVLLSPACASFDQFANFEERGDAFARLARAIAGEDTP
jgi:UDP-N-acetylmuramoylalanine--D-glutamate ligase